MSTNPTNEIEELASHWLIRRDSRHWTQADQLSLERWLDAATQNRVAFLRLELAWEETARLKALGTGVPGNRPPPPGHWNLGPFFDSSSGPGTVQPRRRRWRWALAASVLIAFGAGGYFSLNPRGEQYATPVGGLTYVPIRDGSKITLNTDSRVRVSLTEIARRVDLKQGEAFFEVARDPNRPFVVEAGRKRIVAVGTKFSVRRDGDSVEVAVTEGKVRLEDTDRPVQGDATDATGSAAPAGVDAPVLLTPGAIARMDGAGLLVQKKSLPEIETRLSWRVGVLMFRDQSLADAVAEFNRYNERRIIIADPATAALRVEGNFKATNADAFVRLLESGFPVRAVTRKNLIVLSSR